MKQLAPCLPVDKCPKGQACRQKTDSHPFTGWPIYHICLGLRRNIMRRIAHFALLPALAVTLSFGQASPAPPLRVGIVGLVHGHVYGFLDASRHSAEIEIVGIAEPDPRLLAHAAERYGF